jgi:hypothetical protein
MAANEVVHSTDSQLTVKGSLAATDNTLTLQRFITWGAVGFQLAGTFTGTVTFECTVDGTNWVALQVFPSNSSTGVTTATAVGVFVIANNAFQGVRVRFSTASSGTVLATIKSLPSQF